MLLLVFLCLTSLGWAQSPEATISGVVRDAQGAVVIDAEVTAQNVATGVASTARTNESGFYSIRNLPIGDYTLTVAHPGFRRYNRSGLTLSTGQAAALDVALEVGQVTESVDVIAAAQLIETRTSDVSQLVETKTVEDIPLGDRRTMNLINLTPAAVFVNYDAGSKPNFSLAGGRTQSQSFFIDGGTGQNMRLGIGQIDIDPPVETVAEVKVLSNNYAAEYGGSAGGVIIATTKSGTNRLRGSLFEYLRNEKLDAGNFFAPLDSQGRKVRAPLRYNVFGGTVGGPVWLPKLYNGKDKTFFFFAYEGSRRRDGFVRTFTTPTALERQGDFSQTFDRDRRVIPIYDPRTTRTEGGRTVRDLFPGNRIPTDRLDPVALKLMQFWPMPNRPPDNATGANNFRSNYVMALTRNNFTAKVDHQLGEKDRISGRYLYNSDDRTYTTVFPVQAAETFTEARRHQNYFYGSWTRVISPSLVNELRGTFADRINHERSYGLGEDWVGQLGIRGVPSGAFPQFSVSGVQTLGAGNERRQFPIRQWQFVENLSWVRGRHTAKFGAEIRPSFNYEVNRPSISGNFSFNTLATGQPGTATSGLGMASLLLGLPQGFNLRETEVLDRSSWYLAWFAQTDWAVHSHLTLNLGVRWEVDTPIKDKNNRMNGFDPVAINPVSGTAGVVKFMGQDGFRTTPYDTDWNNFGPRFGFAWKPWGSSKTVVRGGWGVFFAHPFDGGAPASAALGYEMSANLNSPDNGITFPFVLGQGVSGISLTAPQRDDRFGAVQVGRNPNTAVTFYEPDRATGYSLQHNFGIQRELPGNMMVEVSYLANLSRKLPSSTMSLNQIRPERLGPSATQRDRPFPQFTNVSVLFPTLGVSNYHAGVLRFQKRFSAGLNVLSTYTWSKFLNNTNEGGATLGNEGNVYSDFYNRAADYGPSENDVPHRFTFGSVYDLPLARSNRWIGDWSVSTVTTLQSGPPFTVGTQVNSTNAFSAGALRADVLRNPNLPAGERRLDRWFDVDAFRQPAPYTFGNQGVNILRRDGYINIDVSLLKNFSFGEDRKIQFRAESFNVTNTPSFGTPGRVLGGPGFGIVSSASPGRRIQLGLRVVF